MPARSKLESTRGTASILDLGEPGVSCDTAVAMLHRLSDGGRAGAAWTGALRFRGRGRGTLQLPIGQAILCGRDDLCAASRETWKCDPPTARILHLDVDCAARASSRPVPGHMQPRALPPPKFHQSPALPGRLDPSVRPPALVAGPSIPPGRIRSGDGPCTLTSDKVASPQRLAKPGPSCVSLSPRPAGSVHRLWVGSSSGANDETTCAGGAPCVTALATR
ncbi:hypothetical protein Micbo1qcDRAFT_210880 [Microdochium bolleyi]|uniref:Uncharacterized protein n=1 Tax=Microdochium bolleyi TaxID=196109 RepID=A0A136JHL4_9PEZI|nr:hypothetical protein Micbo1qcDRAFT_210880 [Microdochium bolleyi]